MRTAPLLFQRTFYTLRCAKCYTTAPAQWRPLSILPDSSLPTFRTHAFEPSKPFLFPKGAFEHIPGTTRWFAEHSDQPGLQILNQEYLQQYGDTMLPIEYTTMQDAAAAIETNAEVIRGQPSFQRGLAPLSLFLSWVALATNTPTAPASSRLYIAQAPLSALPAALHNDFPIPDFVTQAGKGDIYDSSLWLGVAPTYTPLHRDPNPNLFVQLAGRKSVRLLDPSSGEAIFGRVRKAVGGCGDVKGAFRGEEMMNGKEREMLEDIIWGEGKFEELGLEAEVESGDGLFIPQGWWHSIKGIGNCVTGSVNWWFR